MSTNTERDPHGIAESLPGLARVAAGAWWRTAGWGIGASIRVSGRIARAAVDSAATIELVHQLALGMREYTREILGVSELDAQVKQLMPAETKRGSDPNVPEVVGLRAQGAELLRQAASIEAEDRAHPAYARILTELAPDEARILRLLATDGPQPSVDVRTSNLFGAGSELVAAGMSMIGAESGTRHRGHVPAYLNNLERLGLIWFSREPIRDPIAYQVLEAQPEVLEAMKGASWAKTVRRSILLTPFGRQFCEVCLPTKSLDPAATDAAAIAPDESGEIVEPDEILGP
jgi:Abortive infection alpha